ncbi:MAG: glycosyltransferase [Flavobacteriales bacterium]|nr:glycosyltransferase [Flavobacteriales bacterium]
MKDTSFNQYKVSIVTACYNSEKYIAETIQSVLNQTYTNWEWLIVDDCSTDNSIGIINEYKDSRIKLIKQEKNLGAAYARNKAIELATGRFLTFIDSDDLWLPNFLETTTNYLIETKEEFVYTSYKRVDENLNPKLDDFHATEDVDFNRLLYNCPISMLTAIYDTKRIGKINIPIVDKREDHAMWFDVLRKIKKAKPIDESLGIYRIRENSYSRNKFKIAIKQFYVYFNYLNLPLHESIYYTFCWMINGLRKYA